MLGTQRSKPVNPSPPQAWGETTPTSLNCFQHQNPQVWQQQGYQTTAVHQMRQRFWDNMWFLSQSSFKLFAPRQETMQPPRAVQQNYFHALLHPHPFPNDRFKGLLHLSVGKVSTPKHIYTLFNFPLSLDFCSFSSPNLNLFGSGELQRLEGKILSSALFYEAPLGN